VFETFTEDNPKRSDTRLQTPNGEVDFSLQKSRQYDLQIRAAGYEKP